MLNIQTVPFCVVSVYFRVLFTIIGSKKYFCSSPEALNSLQRPQNYPKAVIVHSKMHSLGFRTNNVIFKSSL